ncbi:MAG TPA: lipopolysaccharide transport periplasmic protein LptA [Dongiaceae bacterium]|jgi:lipopolysaccharide export system protein LptA|nr:lipopolysaccharide transport periplasmic protein LptA [Dongiaceae bacterium]
MNRTLLASFFGSVLLLAPALGIAKSSDRNQPMNLDAGHQTGTLDGTGKYTLSGGVIVTQGTMDIRSANGEISMRDGEVINVTFTGSPVTLKQQMEDGSPMTATANRVDYDMIKDIVVFTGNYTVKSPKGSNSGQKMVYNLKTGTMESGGDGTRVRTIIQPKSTQQTKVLPKD